jgi:uncharacterized protein YjbI with pentapeptide repeats
MTTSTELLRDGDVFEGETFVGLDAPGLDLSRKEFQGCTFRHGKLPESIWTGAVLEDCVFELCDLTRIAPKGIALRDVRFVECKLLGVDWKDVGPSPRVSFEACDLRYASFAAVHLRSTAFVRSQLVEASFVDVDLEASDFDGSDLTGATFRGCALKKTDFSRARGVLLDPAANRVKDARVSLEAAVLLARSFGMRVSGFDADDAKPQRRK